MKVKKNDNVVVLTGKDQKKTGKVLEVMPKTNRIIVYKQFCISEHIAVVFSI